MTFTDLPKAERLTANAKFRLVRALLNCPSIADTQKRATILKGLHDPIKHQIDNAPDAQTHVINIVDTCLNFASGIEELIEAIRFFEGEGSLAMQRLNRVVAEVLPFSKTPCANS